jgi:hypothetical protein
MTFIPQFKKIFIVKVAPIFPRFEIGKKCLNLNLHIFCFEERIELSKKIFNQFILTINFKTFADKIWLLNLSQNTKLEKAYILETAHNQ